MKLSETKLSYSAIPVAMIQVQEKLSSMDLNMTEERAACR